MNTIPASRPAPTPPAPPAPAKSGPDLVVDDIRPNDSFPWPGEAVYFDVTVTNKGDKAAGAFNVRLSSDDLDQTSRVKDGLQPGAKVKLRQMGPLQVGYASMYWVQATADSSGEVDETREDNNDIYTTVMPQQPPQPPPMPPNPPIPHPAAPTVLLAE